MEVDEKVRYVYLTLMVKPKFNQTKEQTLQEIKDQVKDMPDYDLVEATCTSSLA